MPAPTVPIKINGPALRAIRDDLGLSQAQFAAKLRAAGSEAGRPNGCTKRLVQRWESGVHGLPHPHYRAALEAVTGLPFTVLCDVRPVAFMTAPLRLDRVIQELVQLRSDLTELDE